MAEDQQWQTISSMALATGPDDKGVLVNLGAVVSETLMPLILELEEQYERAKTDDMFWAEMNDLWTHYVGRPSPCILPNA